MFSEKTSKAKTSKEMNTFRLHSIMKYSCIIMKYFQLLIEILILIFSNRDWKLINTNNPLNQVNIFD